MRRSLAEVDRETERLIQRPIGLDQLAINTKRISLGAWLLSYLPVISWYPRRSYQVLVFVLTFACYTSYHMTRKTFSAAKGTLGPNCSTHQSDHCASDSNSQNDTGWKPFNETNCEALFGIVDNVWSFAYALFLFGSGIVAERVDLRYFLTVGMIGSAISTGMLGVAYFAKIYHLYYFIIWMAVSGIMQSTGWPGTVAVMGNWFGIKRRGFFMGVWNAHTSVGNILGTIIPAFWVGPDRPWGWAFVVPALIMLVVAMAIFFFLVVDPTDIGQTPPKHHISQSRYYRDDEKGDTASLNRETGAIGVINDANGFDPVGGKENNTETKKTHKRKPSVTSLAKDAGYNVLIGSDDGAIGIVKALMIPGVVEFSLALFCSKLVAYTFLFWLPYYVRNTEIGGNCLGSKKSDFLSTFFDVGGIVGGIAAGVISDLLNARAISCTLMLYISVPALYILHKFGSYDFPVFISLLILCGILVNGPYACITTAVSNDLGTHKDLKGNQRAKATVSAIIDGTGSVGAAIGPLLTGFISSKYSWDDVFYLLMASSFVSALLLTRLVIKEILELYRKYCRCYTCLR